MPDVDDPEEYRRRLEALGIEPPKTRGQSTGRPGGGIYVLLDGSDLGEEYWQQGPLGDPCWGDLKAACLIGPGARHPFGPVYDWIPDSGIVIAKPSLEYASMILDQRRRYREANKAAAAAPLATADISSTTGENRNNRLISLRGTLLNLGYSDEECREALIASNEQFREPLGMREMEDTAVEAQAGLRPAPGEAARPGPRLRVAPPDELAAWADGVAEDALAPLTEAIAAIRPKAGVATWGDPMTALDLVGPAAEVLGGIGDLDLLDFGAGLAMITTIMLPPEYTSTLAGGLDEREALEQSWISTGPGGMPVPRWAAGCPGAASRPGRLAPAVPAARGHRAAPAAAGPGKPLARAEFPVQGRRQGQRPEIAGPLRRPDPVR